MAEMTVDEFKRKYRVSSREMHEAMGVSKSTLWNRVNRGTMSVIVKRGKYRIIETQGEGTI